MRWRSRVERYKVIQQLRKRWSDMVRSLTLGLLIVITAAAEWDELARDSAHAVLPASVSNSGCQTLLESYQNTECPYKTGSGPPREMPAELVERYTMDSRIQLERFFVDDSNSSQVTDGSCCLAHSILHVKP